MKNSFTKIVIILSLCITIFVSICPPSFATPRRVEECGIESYVSRADPICGAITTRSAACGVEQYKEQQSKTCPGYLSAETLWFKKWNVLDSDCSSIPGTKGTYQFTGNRRQEECIDNCDGCNKPRCVKYAYAIECARTESIPKCRLPAFGAQAYKQCSHPSHGYNTCAREEFGKVWKDCEVRKTKAELTAYIEGLSPNIDVMGVALIQNTGNLLKLDGNEIALACYIKRWDSDPLYKDAIEELKTIQFPALFGVTYDSNNYDCSSPPQLTVSTESCSDGTPRCKFQTAYNAALKFFETNKAEVAALIDDIVARTDSTYKTQLESLNAKLDSYYKS
ncbi:hypothetical protein HUN01_00185 (plasmid) [Nostoc edaphicum CCNP1411]|uniref:Uncharacterized protein n=1 Tax=Nostoc edaphicum CCNP1411 TaxID=1472755 RepID=A0A7D7QYZ5_9NOSO|nr:hypothetical protein [Nostoc edaphicum]QMS86086.1 hypothetical protein HUN01_00185 [Nostoc edaphicum CCNP1411]